MENIAEKHGGLSVAIVTAANAIRNKLNVIIRRKLKLKSYVSLFELELFTLICTIYPEDYRIPVDDLVAYGMGINLFEDDHTIIGARDRVQRLIDISNQRKKYKLHLEEDEYDNQCIRMDVDSHYAAKRTSKCKLVFKVNSMRENFPTTNEYENCYVLSFVLKTMSEHPTNWTYPKLALLLLKYRGNWGSRPADFFQGMRKLRVLSLDVSSLPESLSMLRNLRTLRVKLLKLTDMSAIGGLVNLEFLIISTSYYLGIPMEMGNLHNLRLLDLRKMNLAYIPPGVLPKMLKLEELYLPLGFRRWGTKARAKDSDYDEHETAGEDDRGGEDQMNASLDEISSLSLNALQICVPKVSLFRKNSPIIKSILRFRILVLNEIKWQLFGKGSTKELQLTGDAFGIKESGICDLVSKTEDLSLIRVRHLKNIMYQLEECEFLRLKKMMITECDELEYLIDTSGKRIPNIPFSELKTLHLSVLPNLKEIWSGTSRTLLYGWFFSLAVIKVRFCHKLKYVFPLSIGRGLMRLKSIEILDCEELEGIFYRNQVDDNTNGIYLVEELYLYSLPKFSGLLVQRDSTIDGIHVDMDQSLTTSEVASSCNEASTSASDGCFRSFSTNDSISRFDRGCNNDETKCSAQRPQQVSVMKDKGRRASHMEMHCAFSPELMNESIIQLKKLKIAFCDALEVIFLFEKSYDTNARVVNTLEELELYGLRNLKHIWYQIPQNILAFRRLQLLILSECHNLYLLTIPMAKHLVWLQEIQIIRCEKMEELVADEDGEDTEAVVYNAILPRLKALELQHMPNLVIFSSAIRAIALPSLELLKLNACNKMKRFSCGTLETPLLKKVQIDESSYPLMGDLNATLTSRNQVDNM